jgi:hypothetical protein
MFTVLLMFSTNASWAVSTTWILIGLAPGLAVGFVLTRLLGTFALRRYVAHVCPDGRLPNCPACHQDLSGSLSLQCSECGCPVVIPACG